MSHSKRKKSFLEHVKELFIAIIFAVIVAAFVRQMWFELYEIPTGSMRPTFKEHDRVLVSKTAYGINTPFQTSHLNFNPALLKRGSIIVFSVDGLDLPDTDTTYFLLFPGKRRYVKRCMGKPGDTLYFYGGKIYGVDCHGDEIKDYADDPTFSKIEHVPYMSLDGRAIQPSDDDTELPVKYMNETIGRITKTSSMLFNGKKWVHGTDLGSFWGIKNYAMARLLEPKDLPEKAKKYGYERQDAVLYLELRHSPELPNGARASDQEDHERYITPSYINSSRTWIALDNDHIELLKKALFTSRFVVRKGFAFRYNHEADATKGNGVFLSKDIPDGTYEFFDGNAFEIGLGSISHKLPLDHPIYPKTAKLIKTLFNSGIELSPLTNPTSNAKQAQKKEWSLFPARYAYFRDGDLFVMGKALFAKDEPMLASFQDLEKNRHDSVSAYPAFKDMGAPLKNGVVDTQFIKDHGLKIPERHYLALGDNYSNSLDSRYFGFVPEENIQGSPLLIFWPSGERFGAPPQPSIPFFRLQNLYVLIALGIISAISLYFYRREQKNKA